MDCQDNDTKFAFSAHVASVFVVAIASFLGSMLPFAKIGIFSTNVVRMASFFGTGAMISLGFVHLMVPAVLQLNDPCMLNKNANAYEALAGSVAVIACIVLVLSQYAALHFGKNRSKIQESLQLEHTSVDAHALLEDGNLNHASESKHSHGLAITYMNNTDASMRKWVLILALELGAAMHSVIIGLAIGVAYENFVPLFIAVSLHQFFEGVAVGGRLADPEAYVSFRVVAFLILLYSLTAPLGIIIGICIHNIYNPQSTESLLIGGLIDSFASGFVIYNAILLIQEDFFSNTFSSKSPCFQASAIFCFMAGAGVMAFLGYYL